jgi:uncharacterized protein
LLFDERFAIEWLDPAKVVGMSQGRLTIVYTQRGHRLRIISARKATRHEGDDYYRQNAP